jgi:hypothetical protein
MVKVLVKKQLFPDTLVCWWREPGDKDSRAESRGIFTDLWRHEAFSGSDVGHGLVVALLVAFPVAWMTEVVVVVLLASHVKLAVVLSFVNSWFLGWPLSRVALLVGKLDQCHCVDGEDDVGVDTVNLDFVEYKFVLMIELFLNQRLL